MVRQFVFSARGKSTEGRLHRNCTGQALCRSYRKRTHQHRAAVFFCSGATGAGAGGADTWKTLCPAIGGTRDAEGGTYIPQRLFCSGAEPFGELFIVTDERRRVFRRKRAVALSAERVFMRPSLPVGPSLPCRLHGVRRRLSRRFRQGREKGEALEGGGEEFGVEGLEVLVQELLAVVDIDAHDGDDAAGLAVGGEVADAPGLRLREFSDIGITGGYRL